MKELTVAERKALEKLQKEYNELHERLGYMRNPRNCEAVNNRLDVICEKMNAILN